MQVRDRSRSDFFSFVIELGVASDFADRTHTGEHILFYEDSVALAEYWRIFSGVPYPYRWKYIGSSVRDSWWNICGMLGDGTCRNVECISNFHPAYEDH